VGEAVERAEAAVLASGGIRSTGIEPHTTFLLLIYERMLGDPERLLVPGDSAGGPDPESAFLLSRVDGPVAIRDLIAMSCLPRLETVRLLALLLQRGLLLAL
jgi:hypothetical protein